MNTTPEEETNPVLLAFKQIKNQVDYFIEQEQKTKAFWEKTTERQEQIYSTEKRLAEEIHALKNSFEAIETRLKTSLSDYIKDLPRSTGMAEVIQKELQSFDNTVNRIPKSVEIKGDFYGFTSQKPLLAYWMLMIFMVMLTCAFYFSTSDDERVIEYKHLVEDFRQKNPKLADKYFGNWYQRNVGTK